MPTAQRDTRLTYDDFVRFPDDGLRHELIDGVHYVTPCPVTRHQLLVGRLFLAIGNYLDQRPGSGHLFMAPFDVIFSRWAVVEPDLMFVAADQLEILTDANIQGAPALVIEILSPGTRRRDLGIKRELFDRGGVHEYWVLDPKTDDLTIDRRTPEGRLSKVSQLAAAAADVLSTSLLPGLSLPLAKLFAPLFPDGR